MFFFWDILRESRISFIGSHLSQGINGDFIFVEDEMKPQRDENDSIMKVNIETMNILNRKIQFPFKEQSMVNKN